jgi:hypothetical protein
MVFLVPSGTTLLPSGAITPPKSGEAGGSRQPQPHSDPARQARLVITLLLHSNMLRKYNVVQYTVSSMFVANDI